MKLLLPSTIEACTGGATWEPNAPPPWSTIFFSAHLIPGIGPRIVALELVRIGLQ
jgi:hypothetical protein